MAHAAYPTASDLFLKIQAAGMAPAILPTITAATTATPIAVTTTAAHGLNTNQWVNIQGVQGLTGANGVAQITVTGATTFTINGSAGAGTYTSGGNISAITAPMLDLQSRVDQGIGDFETRIGRKLIAVSATYLHDANGYYTLPLQSSLYSLTSLSILSVPKVLNQDFWLYPADGPPYDWIRFLVPLPDRMLQGSLQAISIAGTWGLGTTIPDLAWNGLLSGMATLCIPSIAGVISQGLQMLSEGKARYQYSHGKDAGVFTYERGLWETEYDDAVNRYTRRNVGLRGF